MPTWNLDKIFRPRRIAVIGAMEQPDGIGSVVLYNLIGGGFEGVVYPLSPQREAVHGIQAYANLDSLPKTPDLAVICTEAEKAVEVVAECCSAGILGLLVLSRGFREGGGQGKVFEDRLLDLTTRYPRTRILGPNSYGLVVPSLNLNASFAARIPKAGHLAFVSQSKGLCAATLDWAVDQQVGFSHFVSLGDAVDVGFADVIDYLGDDPRTRALILHIVSIGDVRQFMSAARAFARTRPIVAHKSGRFAESAETAALHSGVMAGEDAVYDAAFQRAGIVRVSEIEEVIDCAGVLARQRTPRADRLAIVTNAWEPGVAATDELLSRGGKLAQFAEPSKDSLDRLVPGISSHGNPIHLPSGATPEQYAQATQVMLGDPNVDAAMVILTPKRLADPTEIAEAMGTIGAAASKPVLAVWMGGQAVRRGIDLLSECGVPTYRTPERAVRAFMYLVSYARNLDVLCEVPRDISLSFTPFRDWLRELVLAPGQELLSESHSKALLAKYEIPVTAAQLARSPEEAVELARSIGFPVVLKLASPQVRSKSEVQGVSLNLTTEQGVRAHFERIVRNAQKYCSDARIDGVTVERMVVAAGGIELILGMKKDPTFGAVIMLGMGGTAAPILHDRVLGLPPLNERLARHMLESLKAWPLLQGQRAKPKLVVDRLIEILLRFSYLVADHPEIKELDVNPLLVTPEDVVAIDARARLDQRQLAEQARPYAHLAIRPYPEEYVRMAKLKDGTLARLRPVKPEDVPGWQELLASCSDEAIQQRFRGLFKRTSHEVATRFCFIDYDRDMTVVAEEWVNQRPTLIGVANLFVTRDPSSAEFAVLVADGWQRKGLGMVLTEYCSDIAQRLGLKTICAVTTRSNSRMISLLAKSGFEVQHDGEGGVLGRKTLAGELRTSPSVEESLWYSV